MVDVDVLVVGAGPVGLTAAAELRRRWSSIFRINHRRAQRIPGHLFRTGRRRLSGYLGLRAYPADEPCLRNHLSKIFAPVR